jgi:hypothetical protein
MYARGPKDAGFAYFTMDRYSHVLRERESDAIGRLPALGAPTVPAAVTAG